MYCHCGPLNLYAWRQKVTDREYQVKLLNSNIIPDIKINETYVVNYYHDDHDEYWCVGSTLIWKLAMIPHACQLLHDPI